MTVELITGHAGSAHISSADDGWRFAGTYGSGMYVLDTGTQLACSVVSATLCTISPGDAIFEGRHIRVTTTTNVPIDNGAQGVNRNDIICLVYEFDTSTEVESASLEVLKGEAGSTATDPTIPDGNILEGSEKAYMPLWRIPIQGLSIGTPVKLYGDVLVTLNGLLSKVWSAAQIPNISAAKITSGTLAAARIPNLDASKITTGTLAAARIPSLDAAKITTGTFGADRIPSLDGAKIGSGTIAAARIPALDASKIASGAFAAARIPSLDASKITTGTFAASQIPNLAASKIGSGTLDAARIPSLDASKIGTGILGTARGGTGNANGTVAKLTSARTFRTNLASTSTASFDGSANVTPGVTGVLPVANGGTGMSADYTNTIATGVVLRCWGRVAELRVDVTKNFSSAYSSFTLGTVPAGYRPPVECVESAIAFNTGGRCALITIGTDGVIIVSGTGGEALGNVQTVGCATWVI